LLLTPSGSLTLLSLAIARVGGRNSPRIQPITIGDLSGSNEHSFDEPTLLAALRRASKLVRLRLPTSGQRFDRFGQFRIRIA
jgi:hypothetical protein